MTDEDIIAKVGNIFGTKYASIKTKQKRKDGSAKLPTYAIAVTGLRVMAIMKAILPRMGDRRTKKIRDVIKRYESQIDQNERRRLWSSERARIRTRNNKGQFNIATLAAMADFARN